MKKDLHNIDKLFKDAIDGQEETPPPAVWDAIDKKLDQHRVVDFNKKYVRLKRTVIVLIILLIGAGLYTLKTWKTVNNREITDIDQPNSLSKIISPQNKAAEVTNDDAFAANSLNEAKAQQNVIKSETVVKDGAVQPGLSGQEGINSAAKSGKERQEYVAGNKVNLQTKKQLIRIQEAQAGKGNNEPVAEHPAVEDNKAAWSMATLPVFEPPLLRASRAQDVRKMTIEKKQLLPALATTSLTKAQPSREPKGGYFTATIFYAPNITVNHIKDDKIDNIPPRNVNDKEQIKNGEHFQFSTTIGVLADYHINQRWALQSGISMTTKSIHINPKTIYAGLDDNGSVKYLYNCSSGYLLLSSKTNLNPAIGDSLRAFDSKNFLQYLSIPLAVKYTYPLKRLSLFFSAGGSINILIKNKIKTAVSDGQVSEVSINNKINGLQKRYFGIGISMGASYDLTDKIAVSFLPSYNFAISSLTRGAAVKTYPDAIGFGAGITYRL